MYHGMEKKRKTAKHNYQVHPHGNSYVAKERNEKKKSGENNSPLTFKTRKKNRTDYLHSFKILTWYSKKRKKNKKTDAKRKKNTSKAAYILEYRKSLKSF